jgi:hypothetical protein
MPPPSPEGREPGRSRPKARKAETQAPPANLNPPATRPSPSDRLAEMTEKRIAALEEDKRRHAEKLEVLQAELDRLRPENARLKEALGSAAAVNWLSTALIIGGGAAIGLSPYWPGVERMLAGIGFTMQIAGVLYLGTATYRSQRWQ